MLKSLQNYDEKISAGLLARVGLELSETYNSLDKALINNENVVKENILKELREICGVGSETDEDRQKLLEQIDLLLGQISGGRPEFEILKKMAAEGKLPSDLYQIEVIQNVRDFYGPFYREEVGRIFETVRRPESEFSFGPTIEQNLPDDISLFMRKYKGAHPFNDFNLLVVGERKSLKFYVHQVFRIYDDLEVRGSFGTLLDYASTFAEYFGIDVEHEGKKSRFILAETVKSTTDLKFETSVKTLTKNKHGQVQWSFSHFTKLLDTEKRRVAMVIVYDVVKYSNYLLKHGVKLS